MSKSVLVIDTPKGGASCPLSQKKIDYLKINIVTCLITKETMLVPQAEIISDQCPLRTFPEKMKLARKYNQEYFQKGGKMPSYKVGWNDCIDEITGGKEG